MTTPGTGRRRSLEEARKRDPLKILAAQLRESGTLSDEMDDSFRSEASRIVNEATDIVESAPYPSAQCFDLGRV